MRFGAQQAWLIVAAVVLVLVVVVILLTMTNWSPVSTIHLNGTEPLHTP